MSNTRADEFIKFRKAAMGQLGEFLKKLNRSNKGMSWILLFVENPSLRKMAEDEPGFPKDLSIVCDILAKFYYRVDDANKKFESMNIDDMIDPSKSNVMLAEMKAIYVMAMDMVTEVMTLTTKNLSPDDMEEIMSKEEQEAMHLMSAAREWVVKKLNECSMSEFIPILEESVKGSKKPMDPESLTGTIEVFETKFQDFIRNHTDEILSNYYIELQKNCEQYLKHTQDKIKADPQLNIEKRKEKIKDLQDMCDILKNKPVVAEDMRDKIKKFEVKFNAVKANFATSEDKAFKRAVRHILASIVTLGIYALVQVARAHHQGRSTKFWRSHKHQFTGSVEKGLDQVSAHVKPKGNG